MRIVPIVAANVPSDALATGVAITAVGLMTKELFGERKFFATFLTRTHRQAKYFYKTKSTQRDGPWTRVYSFGSASLAEGAVNGFGNLVRVGRTC